MPDICVTGLVPRTTGALDALEADIQRAAADDERLGLDAGSFHVDFLNPIPTASRGRRVRADVTGLFDRSVKGHLRTGKMRDALCARIAAVIDKFVAEESPNTREIHVFCPRFRDGEDGIHLVTLQAT